MNNNFYGYSEILKKERDEFEKEKDAFRKEIDAFNADRATQMPQR